MKAQFDLGRAEIEVSPKSRPQMEGPESEVPFKILLLGEFGGNEVRSRSPQRKIRPLRLDRDNFEEIMSSLDIQVSLALSGPGSKPLVLRIRELEDFHPDRLFESLPFFRELRKLREQLQDPATFPAAAARVQGWSSQPVAEKPASPAPAPVRSVSPSQLLDEMLGGGGEEGTSLELAAPPKDEWQDFLGKLVAPHLKPGIDPRQPQMLALVDATVAGLMRQILHHPSFQAVEALWRGLFFLISRLETDENLQIHIADLPREALFNDLLSIPRDQLDQSLLFQCLIEEALETPGADPWALVAGCYQFGDELKDILWLSRMSKLAAASATPFLGAASPRLLGIDSFSHPLEPRRWEVPQDLANAWQQLRGLEGASSLGLALPRFLLRLPYGRKFDPLERFEFEEMEAFSRHEDYLWGNPALGCAYLVAGAFLRSGWDLQPGEFQQLEGLPFHVYEAEGESLSKPCAETLMTMEIAETILEKGIMPFLSFKGRDFIRLARFQSLASPPASLAGRWRSGE
jgi:type VI secretion system protein ImpC